MKSISIWEMGAQLSRLEHLLKLEGELFITLYNKPIARLLPIPDAKPKPSHAELRATLPKLSIPSEFLIREDRDAR